MRAIHWFWFSGSLPPRFCGGQTALHCLRCSLQQKRIIRHCLLIGRHIAMLTSFRFSCFSVPTFFTSNWRRHLLKAHLILILEVCDRFGPLDPMFFAMIHTLGQKKPDFIPVFYVFYKAFFGHDMANQSSNQPSPESLVFSPRFTSNGASAFASGTPLETEPEAPGVISVGSPSRPAKPGWLMLLCFVSSCWARVG